MKNPTPTLPLSGEGDMNFAPSGSGEGDINSAPSGNVLITPPPDKGEAGRGLRLHNLNHQKRHRQHNRNNPTEPEKRFWSWVRGKQLGCKFRRQHGIGCYIVDFYCAEYALIIELDGDSHYTDEGIASDSIRTSFLISKGFILLRFTNLDVIQNKEGVLAEIMTFLETRK